jgi:MFS family permease
LKSTEKNQIWKVIGASSVGTLIEWYDFYIFGSLAPVIASHFFPKTDPTAALLSTLATFAAGFIVRPFGALVFGRLGDIVGRKYTFLLTLVLMGGSTFAIGLIPGYDTIGFFAPVLVLLLRLLQGLALGGEYGGAATYVAEHAPIEKRGYYTSWIQTTATLGLLFSLGIILLTRYSLDTDATRSVALFNDWGWRIPFLVSILLVGVSVYIRLRMNESPLFAKLKEEGATTSNPLKESFARKANLKMVLLALFGVAMGQGVVWYTGQFYAQSFLENVCKVNFDQSRTILIWAIVFATPFFVLFGRWSDRIGRKWIMMAGMAMAVFTYRPLFSKMENISHTENLNIVKEDVKIIALENNKDSLQTTIQLLNDDAGIIVTKTLKDTIKVSTQTIIKGPTSTSKELPTEKYWQIVLIVALLIFYVTMVYGPIAAFLVELFPTKIRYTSMSLPYHIGNGIFGGLTPFIATLLTTTYQNDVLSGLWYPILIGGICLLIGTFYVNNKIDRDIQD